MKGHKKIAEEYRMEAEEKALVALSRSNFLMFGYWAATWDQMNKLSRIRQVDPFRDFVEMALSKRKGEIEEKR
jgi:hypothetical protein